MDHNLDTEIHNIAISYHEQYGELGCCLLEGLIIAYYYKQVEISYGLTRKYSICNDLTICAQLWAGSLRKKYAKY